MAFTRKNPPPPKVIENGVTVAPMLQVGEMSIDEWRNRTTFDSKYASMSRADLISLARQMGFTEEEIAHEFRASVK